MAEKPAAKQMNTGQFRVLGIAVVFLLAGLVAVTFSNRQGEPPEHGLLFPDLKSRINDISQVSISKPGETLTITNESGKWVLAERRNYPADTGKLRQLLLALADASKLEQKTSNPEMYARLGVEDPGVESKGQEIRIIGPETETALIIGNLAQRKYRYVRIPGQAESWLIDQNPNIPSDAGGWLLQPVLDIDSSLVRSVTITHGDSETIHVEKADSKASNFDVADIPAGRELSYPSVANGIAGVLSKLNLQDVAPAADGDAGESPARTVFTTFDGLEITVDSSLHDGDTWITVSASPLEAAEKPDAAADEAAKINERLSGWRYQIQSYKGDQLRRRWQDLLKAKD
jgi:Domain of unknown function (DUF4340)